MSEEWLLAEAERMKQLEYIVNAIESKDPVKERERLEAKYGKGNVWDVHEVVQDFTIHGFMAPLVCATSKKTGKLGTLYFQPQPRFYFDWAEDKEDE